MSGDRLTLSQILLLTAYAGGMSAGQLLFKMAANSYGTANVGTGERLLALFCNLYFLSALVLYAGFALLWVWILVSHLCLEPIHSWRWRSRSHLCLQVRCLAKRFRCA